MTATGYSDRQDRVETGLAIGSLPGRISWAAIFAGAALTVALTLALNLLGAGVGLSMLRPIDPGATPSGGTFGIGGALWWVVSNWIAVLAGAHFAGRVSNRIEDADGALHGVTVWAVSLIAVAWILASSVGSAVGGASRAVGAAAPQAAQALQNRGGADSLLARADSPDGVQAQLRQFVADPSSVDRPSLVRAIAAQAGIPEDQADARLTQYEQQARSAADKARRVASQTAIWSFIALMVGLAAACFGGIRGVRTLREAEARHGGRA
jgi:hypothetical protein